MRQVVGTTLLDTETAELVATLKDRCFDITWDGYNKGVKFMNGHSLDLYRTTSGNWFAVPYRRALLGDDEFYTFLSLTTDQAFGALTQERLVETALRCFPERVREG